MALDPRDAIWNETYDLQYNASYTEEIEKALLARWVWLDSITRIVVSISSGGAALAGLVFWKNADYTFLWPLFTSASALLAIISQQLNVVDKVKRHAAATSELSSVAFDSGTLIVRMKVNPQFTVSDFEKKLLALRERYSLEMKKVQYDLLLTRGVQERTQAKVDKAIAANTVQESQNDHR
jgi:hypothetical protein